MSARPTFPLVLGWVLVAAGLFVALRPLWTHDATITGQRAIDIMFAFYFLASGSLKIRRAIHNARA
ncbi:MAG TPA: hypothetical protein VHV78_11825 [Gemmatimonadaceae bacterium]|nr:hypothetical protein [Gemmatimonadaceae bacterium]